MGMQFNPMYQPTSTTSITVDGDLDVNPYDVLGTDGKFDTVEASEFVGGVGNFESGLISGNLQLDGNLILEGSINNVNIADDGEITTAKGVNALDFNGVVLKATGSYTVTPTDAPMAYIPYNGAPLNILPLKGIPYNGVVRFKNTDSTARAINMFNSTSSGVINSAINVPAGGIANYVVNNLYYLTAFVGNTIPAGTMSVCRYTLS